MLVQSGPSFLSKSLPVRAPTPPRWRGAPTADRSPGCRAMELRTREARWLPGETGGRLASGAAAGSQRRARLPPDRSGLPRGVSRQAPTSHPPDPPLPPTSPPHHQTPAPNSPRPPNPAHCTSRNPRSPPHTSTPGTHPHPSGKSHSTD